MSGEGPGRLTQFAKGIMDIFEVEGGNPISGSVLLSGAKNAATKMMAASLLTDEEVVLENYPDLGDTQITAELLSAVGTKITKLNGTVKLITPEIKSYSVPQPTRRNRIPILLLSPLLYRVKYAAVPIMGGDKIGTRPVNFHLQALKEMGAEILETESGYEAHAEQLHGATIVLPYPSVGATENIILAGVLARGRTMIINAAVEPEIIDLIKLLQKMGAIIELGAERRIFIEGVAKLHGATHKVMFDRNEAVSFACLGLATGGQVKILGAEQENLLTFLNAVRRIGANYRVDENGIEFEAAAKMQGIHLETDTHPGFMTDWQQPFCVLLTQAWGISVIHETVYENRFGYAETLKKMGADITTFNKCLGELHCRFREMEYAHSCVVRGRAELFGSEIEIPDIRAGMAHLIAAFVAKGTSRVFGIEHLDRGYENLEAKIAGMGGRVRRVTSDEFRVTSPDVRCAKSGSRLPILRSKSERRDWRVGE